LIDRHAGCTSPFSREVILLLPFEASVKNSGTDAVTCALAQWRRQFSFGAGICYKRDSTSFLEQAPWKRIAVISSGAVALTRQDTNGVNTFLGLSGPGDVIGAEGYANNWMYHFTARALTDVTLQFASAESVAATLASSLSAAQFYSRWVWRLSCRITDHLTQAKTLNAADRLLILLMSLGTLVGKRYRDGILVQVDSDITLADLLNLEAPNFSRTKRLLIQQGKIVQHGRTYRLRPQNMAGHTARCRTMHVYIDPIII
jgi:CRP-like cAMP-binding protein